MRTSRRQLVALLLTAALLAATTAAANEAPRTGETKPLRPSGGPALGALAPNFTLPSLDGRRQVRLVDFQGKKPVALIFGSYT